ncbi:TonB-linked outer membrane protein, SusC/RagA family [Bacteroidales bacterium WCE2004]|nr:TonB-linked outer membrane protein, SusC/RagA family [Bacteroidales bacterium WCE2004]
MKAKHLFLFLLFGFAALSLNAQNLTVKGTITDGSNGDPIPFASVVVKGTGEWTTSDVNGQYTVKAPTNGVLSVECLSYVSVEIAVNGQTDLNIVLQPDFDQLSEAVVIGYGVQQKKLITGSTIQVKGDDLTKLSTTSVLGALQSQSPGVTITQSSGQPGEGFKVNIRGMGTIGNSDPLYVIDGVIGGSLSALNPADIESIDVLKDAASAAIYGARAANGVVLVTTRQGKEGRAVLSYDAYYGQQYIAKMPNLCNAQEYIAALDLMYKNEGIALTDWAAVLPANLYQSIKNGSWKGTNWMEEAYNKGAMTTNHAINLSGGTADHKYSIGLSYTGQEGLIGFNKIRPANADYNRYTFRVNTDNVVIKNDNLNILRIGQTLNFNHTTNSGIANDVDIYWNSVHNILRTTPLLPAYKYDENGNIAGFYDQEARSAEGWNFDTSTSSANPLAYDYYTSRGLQESSSFTLQASAFAELQPVKNLKFKTQFGYVMNSNSSRSYNMTYNINAKAFNDFDTVSQSMNYNQRITWENTVSYSFSVKDLHNFDFVAGTAIEKWGMGVSISGKGTNSTRPNDWLFAYLSNTKPTELSQISVSGAPRSQGALASFFGRVNYNYDSKYLFSATVRGDKSSNFARGHRLGIFPSASAGWVISSEPWMADAKDWLSFLKLRASWGQNGNASIDNFQYLSTIVLDTNASYAFDSEDSFSTGAVGDVLANPDVSWETSQQLDLGIDARFFNSRLGVTIDGYIKDTRDWLVRAPIPSVIGLNPPYVNGGDIRNAGIELAVDWSKNTGDFTYGINVNGAYNHNRVTRIANAEGIIHGAEDVLSEGTVEMYRAQVGYPIGYFYGYKTAGVFQNQAQVDATAAKYEDTKPGDLIIVDVNGDGIISADDRTMIGDPNPDFTAGLNFWMSYKGFDFSLSGYGAFGQQVAKSYRSFADSQRDNFTTDVFQTWQGEGTSNRLPILTFGSNRNWQYISDIYIENGDYFKVSNVTFGYDFRRLLNIKNISKCRLYFSAQNLLTITGYSGMDPEMGKGTEDDWVSGIDVGFYPSARTFLFGVNIQF